MISSSDPGLVVFDCDGTLVDSQHSIISAMNAAFDANHLPPPTADAVRHVVGLPLLEAMRRLLPDGAPGDHQRLEAGYVEAFRALRAVGDVDDPLYPGALDVIDRLGAAGWVLGVATGKSIRGLLATLETHDIKDRFQTLQTADMGPGKPNPDMLLSAMNETGADPGRTVMVGDTTFDMEMAKRAGTLAIGVSWGYHPDAHLHSAGADAVIDEFEELPGRLAILDGQGK